MFYWPPQADTMPLQFTVQKLTRCQGIGTKLEDVLSITLQLRDGHQCVTSAARHDIGTSVSVPW